VANPFDQFDTPAGNPFDQFDNAVPKETDAEFIMRTTPELVTPPQRSLINRLTGGAITMRGDEGFQVAPTGFAPSQALQAVEPVLANPEIQAMGQRLTGAVGGSLVGGAAGSLAGGVGAIPGAILGGLAGAAAVEPRAQAITPREESLAETGINLASAGLPPLGRVGTMLPALERVINPRLLQAAGEAAYGVGVGEAQLAGQTLLEQGRLPTLEEARNTALLGGLIGAAGGAALPTPQAPQIPKSTQILADAAKPAPLANVAAETASATQGSPYALQESINKMVNIQPNPPANASIGGAIDNALGPILPESLAGLPENAAVTRAASQERALAAQRLDEIIAGGKPTVSAKESAEAIEQQLAQREVFERQAQLEEQFRLAKAEEAIQQAEAARLAQPEQVILTSSPANQQLQMLDTRPGMAQAERARLLQQIEAETPVLPQVSEPMLSPQAQRMQDEFGRVNPQILGPLAGGGIGGVTGFATTERQEGESEQEFQARRLRNAALGTIGGTVGGGLVTQVASKALAKPIRNYTSPVLKEVDTILTPKEGSESLFEKIGDAYTNFRYRYNTRYAPIGEAQRSLYKDTGRTFTPNRYYDLERGFERLAGAPVQAEGEVELLQNVIGKLPKENVPHFDTYLTLARIEDRLTQDPTRKRVGDWTLAKAQQGLADLEAEIGPDAYQQVQQAGQEFQDVMKRSLQIQVDSGRMSQDLMDRVLASNDFYAPFKVLKYYEGEEGFVKGAGRRIPSSEQLAKKITGIDDTDFRIDAPSNVAAEQVYKGYILAQKNRKLRELATLSKLDTDGDYVNVIGPDTDARQGYEKVSYFVNGDKRYMEVSKPIADSLAGLDGQETGMILGGLGKISSVFKAGATGLSVPFNLSNALIFDPIRLGIISRYGFRGPQDFLWTAIEWPKALASSVSGNLLNKPNALYDEWIRSGAANSTLARVLTPEAFASRMPKNMKVGETLVESNFGLEKPLKAASLLSNTLEETTKLWGLQRAKRLERLDELSPAEFERRWPEIVTEIRNYAGSPDFARAGVDMKPLNIILPFLNPRWQGATADFARLNPFRQGNAKDAGAAWARMGSLIALPAAALAVYNLQDDNAEDYKQIPQEEKDRFYHIPLYQDAEGKATVLGTGTPYRFANKDGVQIRGYYRVPKREFPGLIGNTIEDFVNYAKDTNPQGFTDIASNFSEKFLETMSPINLSGDTTQQRLSSAASGLNPAIRLPIEIAANRNFFTGRETVPRERLAASPELRYTENTPDVYKDVAKSMPDALPEVLRSPANLQQITEGLTGGFVRQFAPPKVSPGNPQEGVSPMLGRFYRSERTDNQQLLEDAEAAERGRADMRIQAQEIASELAEIILSKETPEERQKVLIDAVRGGLVTPDVERQLTEEIQDSQRGLTYEDRVIKRSYSVAGGFRAQYYAKKLAEIPAEQRAAYLAEQARKGLLTNDVAEQLSQLIQ